MSDFTNLPVTPMPIMWMLGVDQGQPVLLGFIEERQVATVYPNGTWWTWLQDGVGGENGTESDWARSLSEVVVPNVLRAVAEAEKAVRRQGLDR